MSALAHRQWFSGPRQSQQSYRGENGDVIVLALYWAPGRVLVVDFELFESRDRSRGLTADIDEAEPFAYGTVKWDGCMQLSVLNTHLCTKEDLERLHAQLQWAREQCAHAMPDTDIEEDYR